MNELDRPGIFKARPLSWHVRTSQQSQAIAVALKFQILAQLDGSAWTDWSEYEEHAIEGSFWVVKGDGSVSSQRTADLALALGWDGDLRTVTGKPPDVVVQIVVKEEEYNGRTQFKAAWINPGDFVPTPAEASAEEVAQLQTRFGSLLRAAAGAAKSPSVSTPKPSAKKKPSEKAMPAPTPTPLPDQGKGDDDADIPF